MLIDDVKMSDGTIVHRSEQSISTNGHAFRGEETTILTVYLRK